MTDEPNELASVLQRLYWCEINARIEWFWDGGFNVSIGDPHNGFREHVNFDTIEPAADWLLAAARRHYPRAGL